MIAIQSLEVLEQRRLLSSAALHGHTLRVSGDDSATTTSLSP